MDTNLLENYISKVRCPKHLSIEYKFFNNETENEEDYSEFERNIVRYINQSGSFLTSIHFESCRNDEVLSLLSECPNLTGKPQFPAIIFINFSSILAVNFMRCKGSFKSLLTLRNLEKLELFFCIFPKEVLQEILQNNSQLKSITLCE